jgi:hypothetical protein
MFMRKLADDAAELPDLDVIVPNQKSGEFEGFGVIIARDVMTSDDMPARVDHERTVIHGAP